MQDLWPLFGLAVESSSVTLRVPLEAEMVELARLAGRGVHGDGERPFLTPWTEGSAQERAQFVLRQYWDSLASWQIDRWELTLGVFVDQQPIGALSLRARDFPVVREVNSSSWLGVAHQGRGLGTAARRGALGLSFGPLEASAALSEVFPDNHASQAVSRKLGYEHDGITRDRRGSEVVTSDRLRLTRDRWLATASEADRPRITGFEACRTMFGL